jgi:hypothetical protein
MFKATVDFAAPSMQPAQELMINEIRRTQGFSSHPARGNGTGQLIICSLTQQQAKALFGLNVQLT